MPHEINNRITRVLALSTCHFFLSNFFRREAVLKLLVYKSLNLNMPLLRWFPIARWRAMHC